MTTTSCAPGGHRLHVLAPRGVSLVAHPVTALKPHDAQTPHFKVSVDSGLGAKGPQVAQALLEHCEQDYATLRRYFGDIVPDRLPFELVVTSGNQGASHATCRATKLSIGAHSGALEFMHSLVIAEEDEVFMGNFGHGWNCGYSNGEGLSRVLAHDMVPGVEPPAFRSGSVWLDERPHRGPRREDWVTKTDHSDTNYHSIGCSVLFLNWLRFELSYPWDEIIAAGAPTLAHTYQNLTGKRDAWPRFKALIDQYFPVDKLSHLNTDNPFPLGL